MTDTAAAEHRLHRIAESFRLMAPLFDTTPLYQHLFHVVADDPDLVALAATIGRGQQRPNLLMASVHFLLLEGDDHQLGQWYASIVGDEARPPKSAGAAFRDFCLTHEAELAPLLATRNVQTNVPKRSIGLWHGLHALADSGIERVALVEVGPSAGLLLRFDAYAYDVAGQQFGAAGSPVLLRTDWRGPAPDGMDRIPVVESRIGIDLQPIDVADPIERQWLRALVWPEDRHKAAVLEAACELAADHPVDVVRGDAIDELPAIVGAIDAELPVVVFHAFVVGHIPWERRTTLRERIEALAAERPLHHLTFEGALVLDGVELATADPHGEWFDTTSRQ